MSELSSQEKAPHVFVDESRLVLLHPVGGSFHPLQDAVPMQLRRFRRLGPFQRLIRRSPDVCVCVLVCVRGSV